MSRVPWGKLRRVVAPGRKFIPQVDGLRFIAITAVVMCHLRLYTLAKHMTGAIVPASQSRLSAMIGRGNFGVELFFVISGFILAMPFARWRLGLGRKLPLRSYYYRRVSRLEPPYIVAVFSVFCLGTAAHVLKLQFSNWPYQWNHFLARLLYQHNLLFGHGSDMSGVYWPLEIGVQFYLLAPALAVVFSVRPTLLRRTILAVLMLIIPMLRGLLPLGIEEKFGTFRSLPLYIEWFLAGFLLADIYLVSWREAPTRSWKWDLASLAGWATFAVLIFRDQFLYVAPFAVLLAYVGTFRGTVSSRLLSAPILTTLGGMCYSIYLLHYGVISLVMIPVSRIHIGSTFATRFAMDFLLVVPFILLLAGTYFIALERPCMDPKWLDKVRDKWRLVPAQP